MRITIRVKRAGGAEAIRKAAIGTAKRLHGEILAAEPRPNSFRRVVGGAEGAPEESLRLGDSIIYQYERLNSIVQFAMETLFDLSPVLSGAYRNSHSIILNGALVPNLERYQPGDEIAIINPVIYARKIEVGKMKMRVSGTSKVYQRARRKIMARFGNVVSVEFNYRAFIGGQGVDQAKAQVTRYRNPALNRSVSGDFEKTLAPSQHNKANVRFPVLIFRAAGETRRRR